MDSQIEMKNSISLGMGIFEVPPLKPHYLSLVYRRNVGKGFHIRVSEFFYRENRSNDGFVYSAKDFTTSLGVDYTFARQKRLSFLTGIMASYQYIYVLDENPVQNFIHEEDYDIYAISILAGVQFRIKGHAYLFAEGMIGIGTVLKTWRSYSYPDRRLIFETRDRRSPNMTIQPLTIGFRYNF